MLVTKFIVDIIISISLNITCFTVASSGLPNYHFTIR